MRYLATKMNSIRIDKALVNIIDSGYSYIIACDFLSKITMSEYILAKSEANKRSCDFFSTYFLDSQTALFKVTTEYEYATKGSEGKLTKPYRSFLLDTYKDILISDGYVLSMINDSEKKIKNLCNIRIVLDTTEAEIKFGTN